MRRDGNGAGTGWVEQMPTRDNTRGRSSSPPMTIPVDKIPYPYPSGNGRVSDTRGYYIVPSAMKYTIKCLVHKVPSANLYAATTNIPSLQHQVHCSHVNFSVNYG
jgi:hypothetical protein